MRPTLAAAVPSLVCAAALACSSGATGAAPPPAPPAPAVGLTLTVADRPGQLRSATLSCSGGHARATGYLRGRPLAACAAARRLAAFLATRPPDDRICTQIYGGPATGRVRGRIAGRPIDRRFARTDGCQIADWERVNALLAPPPVPPTSP
jgi:hypothetical protein